VTRLKSRVAAVGLELQHPRDDES